MDIKEKSKKLAEFLGWKKSLGITYFKDDKLTTIKHFDYVENNDWNGMMEVVNHIENKIIIPETDNCFNVTIGGGLYCTIQDSYGELIEITCDGATKLECVFEACVKFVEWYEMQR